MTARTTAHLVSVCDDYFSELRILRGEARARLYYESHTAAIDRIETIQQAEGIDCDFHRVSGFLFAASQKDEMEVGDGVRVTTTLGTMLSAGHAVVATNSPINDRMALHTKQAPYRTYAMAFEIERSLIADGLYWDTEDPYHYVRLQPDSDQTDFLIVGGEDHKTGEADNADARFEALDAWTRKMVPDVRAETHRWSGQVMETMDYAGFIGRSPGDRRVFVATGDSGQGMTHGVVAGLLISDLISRDVSPWEELYEPSRLTIGALGSNLVDQTATTIKNLAEYVAQGEVDSVDKLGRGEGAIVREGLNKIAAYRDENGTLYKRSAACTHIGCHVLWNSLERCWDCPCHGSHFGVDGTALNGPAILPLAKWTRSYG